MMTKNNNLEPDKLEELGFFANPSSVLVPKNVSVCDMNGDRLRHRLKLSFGYDSFRPMQEEIIQHTIKGGDSLVLMPTGGGKSLCFQMAALMMEGMAVVVSPLISLMKDQVGALRKKGIAAEALNSSNDEDFNQGVVDRCLDGKVKLLYISPERLLGGDMEFLMDVNISLFAIDEAHCISIWGHDFRLEYTQLGQLREIFSNVPIMALTATADKITKQDILIQLHIEQGRVFIGSFDRPNLSLNVKRGYSAQKKLNTIVDLIHRHHGESGIIYCQTRKTTKQLAEKLRKEGIKAGIYHAGLLTEERNQVQDDFLADRIQVVCATIAFGMGIDKSNIRFVIHYNMPQSIESFYQEIGRGGRDGLPCETVLFYSYFDLRLLRKFALESGQPEIRLEKLQRMIEYTEAQVCRRRILLNYFGEISDKSCGNCDVCRTPPNTFDGTTIVQDVLSTIVSTDCQVGFTTAIDILHGSLSSVVVDHKYNELKNFGVGKKLTVSDWYDYMLQILQMGFVEIAYDQNYHLLVSKLGEEVLSGKRSVQLAVIDRGINKASRRIKEQDAQVASIKAKTNENSYPCNDCLWKQKYLKVHELLETPKLKDVVLVNSAFSSKLTKMKELGLCYVRTGKVAGAIVMGSKAEKVKYVMLHDGVNGTLYILNEAKPRLMSRENLQEMGFEDLGHEQYLVFSFDNSRSQDYTNVTGLYRGKATARPWFATWDELIQNNYFS